GGWSSRPLVARPGRWRYADDPVNNASERRPTAESRSDGPACSRAVQAARERTRVTPTGVTAFLALVSAIGAGLAGCGGGAQPVASLPPPEVSVSQPIERPVSDSLEFTGRIEAVESVDGRARVSGYITKVAFDAGALVKEGDLLFEIDPREYQTAVTRAQGDIARLRANLARAGAEVARTQKLRPSGAVSEREVDVATASKGGTEG